MRRKVRAILEGCWTGTGGRCQNVPRMRREPRTDFVGDKVLFRWDGSAS